MSELNLTLFIINICVVLLGGAILPILPLLTRKSFLFGVKVPPEVQRNDEARALKKSYVATTTFGGVFVLIAAIVQYIIMPNYTFHAVMLFPFVLVVIQLAAFVPKHKRH